MPGKSAPGEFAALHRSTADEGFHADKLAGKSDERGCCARKFTPICA
jgi:hypothetical protein